MSDTVQKIRWFLRNLDLMIADRTLCRDSKHLVTFFDTADVRAALLGREHFYTQDGEFLSRRFEATSALVQALLCDGWLGPIRMLDPHQKELQSQINLDFGTETIGQDPRHRAHDFLKDLNIDREFFQSRRLKELEPSARIKHVREHAGSAEKLFKAIQFVRGSWRVRLVNWLDDGHLVLSGDDLDLSAILKSETFTSLQAAFSRRRPQLSMNNFTDAVALANLADQISLYNSGKRKGLPVIFSPDGTFEKVISAARLQNRFKARSRKGAEVKTIRDADYFIFKAIFDPPEEAIKAANGTLAFLASDEELTELRQRVARVLRARSDLEKSLQRTSGLGGLPLQHLISELRDLSFFENVWLPMSPQALEKVEEELQEAAEGLRSQEYQHAVEEALVCAKREFEEKGQTFTALLELWDSLAGAKRELHKRLTTESGSGRQGPATDERRAIQLDPFLYFGLIRFSFPARSHDFIVLTLSALASTNDQHEEDAALKTLEKFRRTIIQKGASDRVLAELAGVFWCLELDDQLIQLLRPLQPFVDPSLDIVLIATLFRANRSVGDATLMMNELGNRTSQLHSKARVGQLKIGLAYLHFHLVLCLRQQITQLDYNVAMRHFGNAITLASEAVSLLADDALRIYALNCHLYYLVERGEVERLTGLKEIEGLSAMRKATQELRKWMGRKDVWQYRFDDTLARYHLLKAMTASTNKGRTRAASQAEIHSERALRAAPWDPEILEFRGRLVDNLGD